MVEYLSGSLYKRRGGFGKFMGKKWEKRGFIFSSDGIIAYYDAETPPADCNVSSARGYLDLKQTPFYLNTKGVVDAQPTPYTLIIAPVNSDKAEPWKLCTETSGEFELWFKALDHFATTRATPLTPSDYKSDEEREPIMDSGAFDSNGGNVNTSPGPDRPKMSRRGSTMGANGPLMDRGATRNSDMSGSEDESLWGRGRAGSGGRAASPSRPLPPPPLTDRGSFMKSAPPAPTTAVGTPIPTPTHSQRAASVATTSATTTATATATKPAAGKKRTGGLKLKKSASTITPVFKQAVAVVCVLNSCMYGAMMAQSTMTRMFYIIVANIVVYQTVMFQDLAPVAATTNTSSAPAAARKASVGAAAPIITAAAAQQSTGESTMHIDEVSPAGDTNISTPAVPEGPPVAGASFERVYTVAPNVPEHTWCQCDHKQFQTRIGPDYKKHGKKAPSGAPIYEPCGVDVICTKQRKDHIAERMALMDVSDLHTNHPHVPPIFIVQMQIPSDPPPNLWTTVEDGPGWAIVMYFKITEASCKELLDFETANPALKLFAQYCEKAETDAAWRSRFKIICSCLNLDQMGLPSMIVNYNAKPVLIRRTGTFYRGKNHVEFDVHVHKFANLAKQSIHMISSRCGEMFMQIGFVVEG